MKSPLRISFEGDRSEVVMPLTACGWGLSNPGCKLHKAAIRCGVTRISDYFAAKGVEGESKWFSVAEGLTSVRGVIDELHKTPDSVCDGGCSIHDLLALERVLSVAPSDRFRLGIARKAWSSPSVV